MRARRNVQHYDLPNQLRWERFMTPCKVEASKRASITIIKRLLLRGSGTIVHLRAAIKLGYEAERMGTLKRSAIVICIYTGCPRGVPRSSGMINLSFSGTSNEHARLNPTYNPSSSFLPGLLPFTSSFFFLDRSTRRSAANFHAPTSMLARMDRDDIFPPVLRGKDH